MMRVGSDLSDEGGLLGSDPGLCGVVMDFLSELSGGGFGLDEGGGSFVAATMEISTERLPTIKVCTQISASV